ncbi:MAG: TolC family protein [Pseudomonadales bacterium]
MINKTLILIPIVVISTFSFANATDLSLVTSSVSNHPNVVEKANEVKLKGMDVEQIIAENGLKVNLSTRSKLPLLYNVDDNDNVTRASSLDKTYFDGVITFEKNLYDFGVVENKINAERLREKGLNLEYLEVFEKTLQKLLNTVNDVSRANAVFDHLESHIVLVNESIDKIKLRFSSGIGTLMEVRQAQLLLLDLETQAQNLYKERNSSLTILREEFDISAADLSVIEVVITQFIDGLELNDQNLSSVIYKAIEYNRSKEIINAEKYALESSLDGLQSEIMPQINMSATAIIYDVAHGLSEYELYGGVTLTMPLFDSGLSNAKKSNMLHKLKIQNDVIDALNQNKSLALNKLIKNYQDLQIEFDNMQQKQVNLTEKLSQLEQRMKVVDEGLLTKLQTQIDLSKTKRNLLAYPFYVNSLTINFWALNEKLIEKINIKPYR